ncbi:MAG: hypothetical protein IKO11_05415 [Lachnospiraceae bacterium]|nr:hypothetical protein [Lachnospiraceae bacterium]
MEEKISVITAEEKKKARKKIFILFIIRIFLWLVAAVSTVIWMYYSGKLHQDGIFDPFEYATLLRPVLYTCLIISIVAVCTSFALYAVTKKIRKKYDLR